MTISFSQPDSSGQMRIIATSNGNAGPDRCSLAPEAAVDSRQKTADSRQRPLTLEKDPAAGLSG